MAEIVVPGREGLSLEEKLDFLSNRLDAAGAVMTEIVKVLNNHREVIQKQSQAINAHGDAIIQLQAALKNIRRRQKNGGYASPQGEPEDDEAGTNRAAGSAIPRLRVLRGRGARRRRGRRR